MGKVLVTEEIDIEVLNLLNAHTQVVQVLGLSPEQLQQAIADYDAVIIRSGTKITRAVIEAGKTLQVIGRAGTGVDNVDVEAATERGIWVVNAPDSNSVAVAEHVLGLMLSLARRIPSANQSLKQGEWRRSAFRGVELSGKTLGIIGLGRIGVKVAERARVFGMKLCAYDPYVAPELANSLGVEMLSFEDVLHNSDFITIHVPGGSGTTRLIGEKQLAMCRRGAYLINCARGSVLDEAALLQALDSDQLSGAALDVFESEPPTNVHLLQHTKVIATPHIAGQTCEAQRNVGLAAAQQVLDVLNGKQPSSPVNAPALTSDQMATIGPYLDLARRLGMFYAAIADAPVSAIHIECAGQAAELETPLLTASLLQGILASVSAMPVNLINARLLARNRGWKISEATSASPTPYSGLLTLTVTADDRDFKLAATLIQGQAYVVEVEGFAITFPLAGLLLYTEHIEQPGILGKMGTLLGNHGINISFLQVGRKHRGSEGILILGVDDLIGPAVLTEVEQLPSVRRACMVELPLSG